ncbi:MAG: SDR family NAD(P)-dependent oxidoreductase [Gemmatimonadales bacterium]
MNLKGRKVLVTGAGGFIGSHLVEALVSRGAEVRAMVRYNSLNRVGQLDSLDEKTKNAIEIIRGDIGDSRFVDHAVKGTDVVFHLAALITIPYSYIAPGSYVETNVVGTMNVLEAVRDSGSARMVHTSTSEVYGSAVYTPIDEKHPLQAQSPYSASKIAADKLVESYVRSFDVPAITVRPFNTYGPRQSPRAILPSILIQALAGDTVRLGSLDPIRDLTYVTDTVEGFLLAATADDLEGVTVNLGMGEGFSVQELVERVSAVVGRKLQVVVEKARIRPEASEVTRLVSDNTMARERLGWKPRVSLDQGLRLMLPWFRDNAGYYDASRYNV